MTLESLKAQELHALASNSAAGTMKDEETGEKKEFTREELECMLREAAKEGKYKIGTHGFVVNKAVERQLEDNGFSVRWLYSETNLAVCDGVIISWDMRD